jgi:hypothetical protein
VFDGHRYGKSSQKQIFKTANAGCFTSYRLDTLSDAFFLPLTGPKTANYHQVETFLKSGLAIPDRTSFNHQ